MQRTIEKLAAERRAAEANLRETLAELRRISESLPPLIQRLSAPPAAPAKKLFGGSAGDKLGEIRSALAETAAAVKTLAEAAARQTEAQDALSDVRDKLWDAESNNHVGMIFKSMEWRVDRLSTAYEDASAIMKKFAHLRDQIDRLLAAVEGKNLPTPAHLGPVLEPLEDWRYLRFENRFRGAEVEIRKQQIAFLDDFPPGGRVLDLGCGRGEFLELLAGKGFQAEGVDLNAEMIDVCRDKGLAVERGDLLEHLAARPDASLDGIFSSQVIEHLPPTALRRMIELSFAKLRPNGRILLETLNPLSVFALVHVYFLDMTHRTPVHPQALQFLLEAAGFSAVSIRLGSELEEEKLRNVPPSDESSAVLNRNFDRLNALLYAPANYSVLGRKG
jgi:2-polyprenyl-3-methyl-5-hydroxy-6-metoxy-1,4-benzoquinol methylase